MTLLGAWRFKLLGYDAGFAQPLFLVLIAVAIALGIVGVVAALRRRRRAERLLSERFVDKLAPGVSEARPALQSGLYTLGLALFAIALAQPECGSHTELVKRSGIDVVVALDASKSMHARDVQPTRIDRARLELTTLLDELKGDRVGIVAFAGEAFIQAPLTGDYAAAKLFLRAVDPDEMPQGGTDIGGALALSRELLDNAGGGARDRVVVLLSDGEDFGGDVAAAVARLKEGNIRVFAVGIGSEEGEPIPLVNKTGDVVGYKRDRYGNTVLTRLDSAGLRAIAEETGGEYFHQPRAVAMREVVDRIDELQKAEFESRMAVRYEQRFQDFAIPGFALLVLGMLIRPSRRERPPGRPSKKQPVPFLKAVASVGVAAALVFGQSAWALGPLEKNHPLIEAGTEAYEEGRYEDALAAFNAARQQLPGNAAVDFNLGNALHKLGRHAEAQEAWLRATRTADRGLQSRAWYNLGNGYAAQQNRKDAISAYRRALVLNPDDELARHNLEVLLRELPPKQGGEDGGTDGGQDAGTDGGKPQHQDGGSDGGSGQDGGAQDGGAQDGGSQDGGSQDGGAADGGGQDGGTDGGAGDGGAGDGGSPDGGGDGGQSSGGGDGGSDGGTADGGESQDGETGRDGGMDGGSQAEEEEREATDGGSPPDLSEQDAEKLLDSMKQNEKNLQLWRFQQKKKPRGTNEKDW